MSAILECKNITKQYNKTCALSNFSLTVERGRILGLLGANGSGKTTLLKLINGLLVPTQGEILIDGKNPGIESKKIVSYLPDKNYLSDWMNANDLIKLFSSFYKDFSVERANTMLQKLKLDPTQKLKHMSKGTKEKVQLILVMSRNAQLYCLDEPIGGVDPASRDYILNTIISNYDPNASIIISTHLISDVESVLDDVVFINNGENILVSSVDDIREKQGKTVDGLFREVFKC